MGDEQVSSFSNKICTLIQVTLQTQKMSVNPNPGFDAFIPSSISHMCIINALLLCFAGPEHGPQPRAAWRSPPG